MQCDTLFILALLLHRIFFVYDVFLSRRLGCPTLEDVKAWEVNRPVYYDLTDGLREPYRRPTNTGPTALSSLANYLLHPHR